VSLHGLLSVTMGVPNVAQTAAYHADLDPSRPAPEADGWFSTRDAGRQLQILPAPTPWPRSCAAPPTTTTSWCWPPR
jgi:hypothetical protein